MPGRGQLGHHRITRLLREVEDREPGAFGREHARSRKAHAPGTTGDQYGFTFETTPPVGLSRLDLHFCAHSATPDLTPAPAPDNGKINRPFSQHVKESLPQFRRLPEIRAKYQATCRLGRRRRTSASAAVIAPDAVVSSR